MYSTISIPTIHNSAMCCLSVLFLSIFFFNDVNKTNLSFNDQCFHWTLNEHIKDVILMTFRNNNFNKTSFTLINTRNILFKMCWNISWMQNFVSTCNSIKRAPQTVMNRPASISLKQQYKTIKYQKQNRLNWQ